MSIDVTDEYRAREPKWCAIHNGWFYRCFELSANIDEWNKCLEAHDTKVLYFYEEEPTLTSQELINNWRNSKACKMALKMLKPYMKGK